MPLPFDFQESLDASKQAPPPEEPIYIKASDDVQLSIRIYKPTRSPNKEEASIAASLIFYHGGGAHSGAGYQLLARNLADKYNVTVYTPDLRGHGMSGGPRGDTPSVDQLWRDVDSVIDHVSLVSKNAAEEATPPPIFLGGHSSGGGLVLNYATWEERGNADLIKGYILVSPQLGYLAKVDRPVDNKTAREPFARVNIAAFIVNGIFGWLGHNHAVQFQYPEEVLESDPAIVKSNTVNMANAITPLSPDTQFQQIELPLTLWVGGEDELFLPDRVASFAEGKPNLSGTVLPGKTHLGVLICVHEVIGPWIDSFISSQ